MDKQLNKNLIQRFYKHTDSDSISINLSLSVSERDNLDRIASTIECLNKEPPDPDLTNILNILNSFFIDLIQLAEFDTKVKEKLINLCNDVFIKTNDPNNEAYYPTGIKDVLEKLPNNTDTPNPEYNNEENNIWAKIVYYPLLFLVYQCKFYLRIYLQNYFEGVTTAYSSNQPGMKHGYSCFPGIVGRFISEHSNAISVMNSTLKPFIDKDDIDNNTIKKEFKGLNFPNYKVI